MKKQTDRCNTCTKPANNPYRVYSETGHIIHGCVDGCHTGHLTMGTLDYNWHHRQEAVSIRQKLSTYHPPVVKMTPTQANRANQASVITRAFSNYRHPMETF